MALQGVGVAHAVRVNATENNRHFCAGLNAVEIRVGYFERTVFIAKEAVANDCLYREAMAHQMNHLAQDDKALEMFVPVFARELRQILQGIALGPATTSEGARRTLTDTVVALSRGFLPRLEHGRLRLRQELESPAELDRIRNACGGLGQRLNEL